ncbi:MAG: PilN domain-containing protein, partial [Caulobacterales bacterium]|nr:PilN domain-containing protein [Caulobacterales bacterium]
TAALAGALAALCAAWSLVAAVDLERRAEALRDAVFTARMVAKADLERASRDASQPNALALAYARKQTQPLAVEALALVTDVLPDDTWLESLSIQGGAIEMTGVSGNATALISRFERHPRFFGAAFQAPVTRGARTEGERFTLAVTFAPSEGAP